MVFNFDFINIIVLSVFLLNLSLGIFIFSTKPKNRINQTFFIFSISATLWGVTMFLYRGFAEAELGMIFVRTLYVAAALIPFCFIFFIKYFPKAEYNLPKLLEIVLVVPFLFVILISALPNLLISGVVKEGGEPIIIFNKIYEILYSLYIVGYFSICYALLFIKYFRFRGIEKQQIKYVIFGTFASTIIGISTNLLMPLLGDFRLNWMGQVGILMMVGSISFSLLKHQLFNIKVIATQFIVFILWASLFIRTLFSSGQSDLTINLIFLILVIIIGELLIRGVLKEVEQRERIEKLAENLERANEKLKELDQMKSEFLSLANHQIKAPLTAIKGYSSMLLEGDFGVLPEKAKDSIDTIMKSCQNLINIVGDFLNISRIEQGRMVYEKTPFDIRELVREVVRELKPNIDKAGLALDLNIPVEKIEVNADRNKIKQVVSNVVDNAIKYTTQGEIRITVGASGKKTKIAVKDSGVGIDPGEMDKLFVKFSRMKDANKTNISGTGLGLYIAKKMTEAHGGDIKVSSEGKGKGTTFTIELPVANSNFEKQQTADLQLARN